MSLTTREFLIIQARELNSNLGDLFQNPMRLSFDDVVKETRLAEVLKKQLDYYIKNINEEFTRQQNEDVGVDKDSCEHKWTETRDMPMVYCVKCNYVHPTASFITDLIKKERTYG